MTFLTPMYAAIAAAIAVPTLVILYFLKLRRRDVEISTTLLWKKAIQDLQANAPFQKLRRNILLILQLIVLAGLLFALAQPQIKSQTTTGQRHVILIDRSGSMLALDETDGKGGKITRLAAAKKQAIAIADSMRESGLFDREKDKADQALVIAFDTQAEVRQQFTNDKDALKRAIESITPTEGPTLIEEAMRLAMAQQAKRFVEGQGLEEGEPLNIHIFSDGRIPDAAKAAAGRENSVEFHRVGDPKAANAAIVGLRAERSFDNPNKLSVYISLSNNEPTPRGVDVELVVNGVGAGIKSATIPAASAEGVSLLAPKAAQAAARDRETAAAAGVPVTPETPVTPDRLTPGLGGVVFSLERGEGGTVEVRLRSPGTGEALEADVLALDDRAWLVVPPAKKMAVGVVSSGRNLFLSSALAGLPLSRLTDISPAQFEKAVAGGTTGEFDVIIFDGYLPGGATAPVTPPAVPGAASPAPAPGPALTDLPPGRYLILGEVPTKFGNTPTGIRDLGKAGTASIVDWKRDHPLLRSVGLDGLDIGVSRKVELEAGSPATAIANSDQGPIILDVTTPDVHAVVVPFDVAESDWPFNVSFVVFMAGSINYLGDDAGTGASGRLVQPGSVLSDRLPGTPTAIRVKPPQGEPQQLQAAADGRIVYGPLSTSGIYEVSWEGVAGQTDVKGDDGRIARYYAADLLDGRESDLAAADTVELASAIVTAKTGTAKEADRKLWPWMLLGALAIVMLEWFVYNRKVHV